MKNGLPHGYGILYYSTGRGEGFWHNGVPHGATTVYADDGSVSKCTFVNGYTEGKSVTTYSDGSVVTEYYKNGKKIG